MADARSPRKRGRDARRDDSPPRRRPPPKKQDTVDRKTECPFLLRVFCKRDGHNKIDDYSPTSVPNCEELQLYTWPDCTLRELTDLVKHALSDARRPRWVRSRGRARHRDDTHCMGAAPGGNRTPHRSGRFMAENAISLNG